MTWQDAALEHAKAEDPREACGLLIVRKGAASIGHAETLQQAPISFLYWRQMTGPLLKMRARSSP
jgi:hypothetical protein